MYYIMERPTSCASWEALRTVPTSHYGPTMVQWVYDIAGSRHEWRIANQQLIPQLRLDT